MAHVVFLRAANVGGKNVFKPTQLVAALSHLDVVNVGAAGTFVIRGKATAASIRRDILGALPFEPAIVVRPAKEIIALVERDPFRGVKFSKDLRGWIGALSGTPKRKPSFPIVSPQQGQWSVRIDGVDGAFMLGLWQRRPGGFLFPANLIESSVGVPATVRWWETIVKIANVIG